MLKYNKVCDMPPEICATGVQSCNVNEVRRLLSNMSA